MLYYRIYKFNSRLNQGVSKKKLDRGSRRKSKQSKSTKKRRKSSTDKGGQKRPVSHKSSRSRVSTVPTLESIREGSDEEGRIIGNDLMSTNPDHQIEEPYKKEEL